MHRNYQTEMPEATDLFQGKGHQQVANAISKVLLSDSSQHIIGLEGNLGAGKSTVIKILDNIIKTSGFHVVTFDADMHQKNLKQALIKTIEQELLKIIDKKKAKDLENLKSVVDTALGKKLRYTKNTSSNMPASSIAFAIALIFSVSQAKPSIQLIANIFRWQLDKVNLEDIISFAIFILPALIPIAIKGDKFKFGNLLKRNSIDTIDEVIDINKEVGSIELRDAFTFFHSVIPKGRSLLLVIDNIDRLSPDIARELWCDLEILTSLGNERFRILLPYSEEHLAKALEKSSTNTPNSGKEFISKRIPIPFSAPPIVTTGWHSQFDIYWKQTLNDIEGLDGVKDLIDVWAQKITPRYLKNLVNRIGTTIDSCPEENTELNGSACAAYLMAVRDNNITINTLLSSPSEKNQETNASDESLAIRRKINITHKILAKYCGERSSWENQIAALHFQTSFKIAQSELIAEPIRSAFNSNNGDSIIELSTLLGFDFFMKQQITNTTPTELVKIADSIASNDVGAEVVKKYLSDINHEINYDEENNPIHDTDLIECYVRLHKNGIAISKKPAKIRQESLSDEVNSIWSSLETSIDQQQDSTIKLGQWNELHSIIRQVHEYYNITNKTPPFLIKISPDFLMNAIYPIKNEIPAWDVYSLMATQKPREIILSSCDRYNRFNDKVNPFNHLLKTNRLGLIDSNDVKMLIAVEITDINHKLDAFIFSSQWYSGGVSMIQSIHNDLTTLMFENDVDSEILSRYAALIIAAIINGTSPEYHLSTKDQYNNYHNNSASTIVTQLLDDNPTATKYLADYFTACKFNDIISWCQLNQFTDKLFPSLEELIRDDRINKLPIEGLFSTHYKFLRNQSINLSTSQIVNWISQWSQFIKKPDELGVELIIDAFKHQNTSLIELIEKYVNKATNTTENWLIQLEKNSPSFIEMLNGIAQTEYQHPNQRALIDLLKNIPENGINYNLPTIRNLIKLLSETNEKIFGNYLSSSFLKSSTTNNTRYKFIEYYGFLFTLPQLNNQTHESEAIMFLDDAISRKSEEALRWLVSQPTNEDGWALENWSLDGLEKLHNILAESKTDMTESLLEKTSALLK